MTTINAELKHKYGTAAAWTSADPTLLAGQLGFESDTGKFKIGDGVTAWTALAYKTITAAEIASLTSAELRTICSDETGTGSLVFATSPTLVTPVLGTPASGDLQNCVSTSLKLWDSVADHRASIVIGDDLNGDRTLTIVLNDANRQLTFGGNISTAGAVTITNAAATVLDDTSVANMVDTLGGAASTGSGGLVRATSPTLVTPAIGTPSSGNVGNCTGQYYALSVGATTYGAPADGATVYFGNRYNAPTSTPDITRVYIPRGGTIIRADVLGFAATAGSNESWEMYIRLNNTTDTLIQALASSSGTRVWSNAALAVTVAAGDYIEIKLVNPAWGTNPANVSYGGNILIVTA